MNVWDLLRPGSGNRDLNRALKRPLDDGVNTKRLINSAPFKNPTFFTPDSLPGVKRFDAPQYALAAADFVPHRIKRDAATTDVHTFDVLCETHFFGHDTSANIDVGQFLLMYTGPRNLAGSIANEQIRERANGLPRVRPIAQCRKAERCHVVIGLKQLRRLIDEQVKKESTYFESIGHSVNSVSYVTIVEKKDGLGGFASLLSRCKNPEDFSKLFVPLGFVHSIEGLGSAYPLVSILNYGLQYVSPLYPSSGDGQASAGNHVYYFVGMKRGFQMDAAFQYVKPALLYGYDDRVRQLAKRESYSGKGKDGVTIPCLFKYIGYFVRDYIFSESIECRSPHLRIDTLGGLKNIYID